VYEWQTSIGQTVRYLLNAIEDKTNEALVARALPHLAHLLPPGDRDRVMGECGFETADSTRRSADAAAASAPAGTPTSQAAAPSARASMPPSVATVRRVPDNRSWKLRPCNEPECVRGGAANCDFLHQSCEAWVQLTPSRHWLMSTDTNVVYEDQHMDAGKWSLLQRAAIAQATPIAQMMPRLAKLLPSGDRARIMLEYGYELSLSSPPPPSVPVPKAQQAAAAASVKPTSSSSKAKAAPAAVVEAKAKDAASDEQWQPVAGRHAGKHNDRLAAELEAPQTVQTASVFEVLAAEDDAAGKQKK
jgi:hypothetical protein